jgi:hypothetical protein
MSLRVPSIYKLEPNADEILLAEAYSMAQVQIDILLDKGISADEYGRKFAINHYKAVSYYYFLINYCILIRHKFNKQSLADIPCVSKSVQEEMQIDCVLKSLECIQKRLGINYRGYLISLFDLFNISYQEENCEDNCQGIGSMILGEESDTESWIIGDCEEVNKVLKGEFKKGEFNVFNFKKPVE